LGRVRLERQTKDLPAALTPEKLIQVVPEKETNLFRMFAHLNHSKFLQTHHRNQSIAFGHDILETYVKVFVN
jgi:hypothetical protein